MASLKELKGRIASVQGTRRITSAMKMVAAAKLKRATAQAEAARPYAERMERMLGTLVESTRGSNTHPFLIGTGRRDRHLVVLVSSDRGLCGSFNSALTREIDLHVKRLQANGQTAKFLAIGRKGVLALRRNYHNDLLETYEELCKPAPSYDAADTVVRQIVTLFEAGEFDVCTVFYNKFVSALQQDVTPLQLIPFATANDGGEEGMPENTRVDKTIGEKSAALYEYEPSEAQILQELLPKNLAVQVYRALLESFASEQGARMTAMDNATRNAGDAIKQLSITYNRSRQAQITKELIEIISGAEAV